MMLKEAKDVGLNQVRRSWVRLRLLEATMSSNIRDFSLMEKTLRTGVTGRVVATRQRPCLCNDKIVRHILGAE